MNRIDAILETYRTADLATRSDMFMNHRDLRSLFDMVENEETAAATPKTVAAASPVRWTGSLRRWLRELASPLGGVSRSVTQR